MLCNVFVTRVQMTTEIGRVLTDMRTPVTFVCFPRTRGNYSVSSDDVVVEASPFPEVFVTALHCTVKSRLLLDSSGVDLTFLQHHESKISPDHSVVKPVMLVPGLKMSEGFGTVWAWKVTSRVDLLMPEEVVLGVKHLPADVTGVPAHHMHSLLVFIQTFGPNCFVVTLTT